MHGREGNLGQRMLLFKYLVNVLGVNVLSMAYRGYSYSDAVKPNERGIKKDADAIAKFV